MRLHLLIVALVCLCLRVSGKPSDVSLLSVVVDRPLPQDPASYLLLCYIQL